MMRAGVIGVGDMGSGLARNLAANGHPVSVFDLRSDRMEALRETGAALASGPGEVGRASDAVFVMVMDGASAREVILGEDGLVRNMDGGAVILTATITPREAREIGAAMEGSGTALIDTPVSGGFPGAQSGTLTMMAAAPGEVLDRYAPVMEAVSSTIHRVGTQPGEGQTVKAVLQSLLGAMFSATFEAAALAAKAGISGEVLHRVVSTSSGGCGITSNALEKIIDRRFEGTGSSIHTMHKDLTISMGLAQELGAPLHTAAAAMQIFAAGRSRYPEGDNWVCTRLFEEIVGAELHRDGAKAIRP